MSPTTLESERYQPKFSVRMALRHHVVGQLKGNTLAGGKVYDNRPSSPDRAEQPCIYVHTKDEPAEIFGTSPPSYERSLQLWIDIYAEATAGDPNPMDPMDVIASQVEWNLHAVQLEIVQAMQRDTDAGLDSPFKFNPGKSGLVGTSMDTDDQGLRLEAGCRITWRFVYVSEFDEGLLDGAEITPFQIATVGWDIDGDGLTDVTDEIRLAQP